MPEPVFDRNDVNAILEVLFDMRVLLTRIVRLLEEGEDEQADDEP